MDRQELRTLAGLVTWKTTLIDVPFSGAGDP